MGPKLRGWYDRRQLLEVGVTIAHSGRRWTGLDRREQDQGQHDHVRPVLSVSTAGMLIRRDVYEELGGFDRALPLMRDDVDLCWRAQAAGHRVLIAPDAVLRHAEAASRERRTVDCAGRGTTSPHRVDKAGAVHTLLVNSRGAALPWVLLRLVVGTVARTLAYLVGKVPGQAVDEISGLLGTLLRPGRILNARRRRGKGTVEPAELRPLFPPPGATVRATVEQVAGNLTRGSDADAPGAGRHGGAVESGPGGDDADFLEVEQFARLKRLARRPGPVLFAVLLLASLVACRALLGGGALAGGALLPVPDQLGDLWGRYADGWHAVGTGTTEPAPPYLALLATLAALLFGSTHTAVTVVLVASVPLAGFAAYLASGSLVPSRLLRAWGSVVYAFLPAVTGALGRRPPGHRRPRRAAAGHGPRRALRRGAPRPPRHLARHLGVHPAADAGHRVHADGVAAGAGPRDRGAGGAPERPRYVRAPVRRPVRHPAAGAGALVADAAAVRLLPDRRARHRHRRRRSARPAGCLAGRAGHPQRRPLPRRGRCRARRPAPRGAAPRHPHRLGRRPDRPALRGPGQRLRLVAPPPSSRAPPCSGPRWSAPTGPGTGSPSRASAGVSRWPR